MIMHTQKQIFWVRERERVEERERIKTQKLPNWNSILFSGFWHSTNSFVRRQLYYYICNEFRVEVEREINRKISEQHALNYY